MNENINLIEILKDCPEGTPLYSIIHGPVKLIKVHKDETYYPIEVLTHAFDGPGRTWITADGRRHHEYDMGECILFPSKEQRDWSKFKVNRPKFDPSTLKPFDKVLVRRINSQIWRATFFSNIEEEGDFSCGLLRFKYVIPYNEETNHLVGTSDETPEYYRYWEN